MKPVFADTGYWIALLDPQDYLHQRATTLTAALKSTKIVTSEIAMIFAVGKHYVTPIAYGHRVVDAKEMRT